MTFLVGTHNAGVQRGVRTILSDVTVALEDGDRVGILGPNGAGKSTLLQLLAGYISPTEGERTLTKNTSIATLTQSDHMNPHDTVVHAIHGDVPEHTWASDPAIRDIHAGLLSGIDLNAPLHALSGGQRRRVALAACLSAQSDVIFLDEPTNHLDVEGVDWLATYLRGRMRGGEGALAVVTHDRWFLDAVCTRIWEVVPGIDPGDSRPQIPGRIDTYEGSYAAYILARAERARLAQQAQAKRANLLRKELAWLRRGAPARTSKPRFRIEAAEELIADAPPPRDQVELVKMATARLGKRVVDLENVSVAYESPQGETQIFRDVTWRLAPAERVGIVGVNGAGKTTLLRVISGEITPQSGYVRHGKTVKVATLSQHTHELDQLGDLRVNEAVAAVKQSMIIGGKEVSASQLVERLGFTRARAWTRVKEISGGERRRLQLMRLLMSEPNVLLLDEPTNDLDTDTLASFEDLLDTFPGTLIVVSHDRYFLQRTTDHQVCVLGDGTVRDLPGGVDQYLRIRKEYEHDSEQKKREENAAEESEKHQQKMSGRARYEITKEMSSLERKIAKNDERIAEVEARMADVVAHDATNIDEITKIDRQLRTLREERDEWETSWLELGEKLE